MSGQVRVRVAVELLAVTVAATMGIVALTMPMVRRLADTAETRFE